jgi:hypothetical protein
MAVGEVIHPGPLRATRYDLRGAVLGGIALKFHAVLVSFLDPWLLL